MASQLKLLDSEMRNDKVTEVTLQFGQSSKLSARPSSRRLQRTSAVPPSARQSIVASIVGRRCSCSCSSSVDSESSLEPPPTTPSRKTTSSQKRVSLQRRAMQRAPENQPSQLPPSNPEMSKGGDDQTALGEVPEKGAVPVEGSPSNEPLMSQQQSHRRSSRLRLSVVVASLPAAAQAAAAATRIEIARVAVAALLRRESIEAKWKSKEPMQLLDETYEDIEHATFVGKADRKNVTTMLDNLELVMEAAVENATKNQVDGATPDFLSWAASLRGSVRRSSATAATNVRQGSVELIGSSVENLRLLVQRRGSQLISALSPKRRSDEERIVPARSDEGPPSVEITPV